MHRVNRRRLAVGLAVILLAGALAPLLAPAQATPIEKASPPTASAQSGPPDSVFTSKCAWQRTGASASDAVEGEHRSAATQRLVTHPPTASQGTQPPAASHNDTHTSRAQTDTSVSNTSGLADTARTPTAGDTPAENQSEQVRTGEADTQRASGYRTGPAEAGTGDVTESRAPPVAGEPATRADTQPTRVSTTQSASGDAIRQTQTYARVTDQPGEVEVTLTYEIPDRVVELETRVPEKANVTEVDGFRRINETRYEWNERTEPATIRYRINPNRTVSKSGPEGADGRYLSVDTGEWALLVRSVTPTKWSYTGQERVQFERNVTTAGPGAAGEEIVYLGEVATFERTEHNQTFELAVPERATMTASPIAVLDSMTAASNALRVGDRDEQVFVVAAPSDDVDWGVQGFQIGEADMWVRDSQSLDSANNVWLHEYVHSRQSFRTTRETRWLTEAMATYYAAALTLEQDRIDFEAFRAHLKEGERPIYTDDVLSDPDTWSENANYRKGALVTGLIDRRVRNDTNRNQTFQSVWRRLNGYHQPVSEERFLSDVESTGGPVASDATATYSTTPTAVLMWNRSIHTRLFAEIPARIGYSLPPIAAREAYRADSVYRENDPVGGSEPIRLVADETLVVDTVVNNAGGSAGEYNATLAVNGTVVTAAQGQIDAGDRQVVPLSHRFDSPGRYEVSIDGENVTVLVHEPGEGRVTNVSVSSRETKQWDSIDVTATVVNDRDIPAATAVEFTRDGEAVSKQHLYLPPESTTRVTSTVTLPRPGAVMVGAGDQEPIEVTVTPAPSPEPEPTTTPTTTTTEPTTSEAGGGFTLVLAVLAVGLAVLLARHRPW